MVWEDATSRPRQRRCPQGHVVGSRARFCPTCGTDLDGVAETVPKPDSETPLSSTDPVRGPDEVFCRHCGHRVSAQAFICVHCGVRLQSTHQNGKDKTIAILLAVFLSFWTWLYTFDDDQQKFWVGLSVNVGGFFVSLITLGALFPLWLLSVLGIWGWSIIDAATRPDQYYANFSMPQRSHN